MIVEGSKVTRIDIEEEDVSIPLMTRSIGSFACFYGALHYLNLENSQITIIGKFAFAYCGNLEKITFSSHLEEIGEGSFMSCYTLSQINFPHDSKLRKIGAKAFKSCVLLVSFEFTPLLESIGEEAFNNINLNFDFRNTRLRNIAKNAFSNENKYYQTEIEQFVLLPATASVESIINCSKIRLDVDENHPIVKKDECGYYFSNGTALACYKNSMNVLIRRGVEIIARRCFSEREYLTSVTIPASVIEISKYAFYECKRLRKLLFSRDSRLKVINSRAFTCCRSLKVVKFPKSLQEIRLKAFRNCYKLKEVIFPNDSQLTYIDSAFESTKIKHLSLPPSVSFLERVTYKMNELESIYVKNEKYESNEEKTAVFSKDKSELFYFIKGEVIPEGVRVIKKGCFLNILNNDYLLIPSSVEVIEDGAFTYCDSFKTIEFAQGSKLRDLGFNTLAGSKELIINKKKLHQKR